MCCLIQITIQLCRTRQLTCQCPSRCTSVPWKRDCRPIDPMFVARRTADRPNGANGISRTPAKNVVGDSRERIPTGTWIRRVPWRPPDRKTVPLSNAGQFRIESMPFQCQGEAFQQFVPGIAYACCWKVTASQGRAAVRRARLCPCRLQRSVSLLRRWRLPILVHLHPPWLSD